jgi:HSP20 family protein
MRTSPDAAGANRDDDLAERRVDMTTLVKWTPFREFDLMERRMRRMLEDVGFGPIMMPAADVYETPQEFVVELEVPGFEEKDLALEVTDHTLTITGEVKAADIEEKEKAFILHERLERHFERRFQLPMDADTKKLAAKFVSGVLEIHTPKIHGKEPRKIKIEHVA